MTQKILFWLGVEFTHFCLSYAMQKKHTADYFSIVDITDKSRKFFETQNLVKFNKTWYFFDHVTKQDQLPDYKYLKEFEKKYNIDLWKLAINERIFYRFYDFHKFSTEEIYSILEQECKLFEKIFDEVKPDFFVTKYASRHHHHLFTEMCNSLGIPVLMLSRTWLGNKVLLSKNSHIFDDLSNLKSNSLPERNFQELQEYLESVSYSKYLSNYNKPSKFITQLKALTEYLLSDSKQNQKQYYYYGRTKFKVLKDTVLTLIRSRYRENYLNNNAVKQPDFTMPFVYFPLHVDMERPLLIDAPFYTNQIEIIRHIAKSLPVGIKLFVKESPAGNSRGWRKISDYEEIMSIPNVTLIHHSVPSKDLFKKCLLVFTVAGTSGFEAAIYEKPSIVFSKVGYASLPSVQKVSALEELPKLIRESLDIKVKSDDVNQFLIFMEKNTIDFDWQGFLKNFYDEFYYDGNLHDVKISPNNIQKFLNLHYNKLEILTDAHLKKIEQYMKN